MANALLAVIALADGARKAGARFCSRRARRAHRASTRQAGASRPRASAIRCERVVIAAGSGSGEIAATAGVELPLAHRDIQMIATEPCEPFVEHLVYHAEERLTLKQVANGNVLIGGGWDSGARRGVRAAGGARRQPARLARAGAADRAAARRGVGHPHLGGPQHLHARRAADRRRGAGPSGAFSPRCATPTASHWGRSAGG